MFRSRLRTTGTLASSIASSSTSSSIPRHIRIPRSLHSHAVQLSPHSTPTPQSAWAAATESAHSVLTPPPSPIPGSSRPRIEDIDPLAAIHSEISNLKHSLFRLLGNSHPSLDTIAKYYFHTEGKHLRPLLVLLMSQATNGLAGESWRKAVIANKKKSVDDALTTEGGVLNDWNPEMSGVEPGESNGSFASPYRIGNNTRNPPILAPKLDLLSTSTSTSSLSSSSIPEELEDILDMDSPPILPTQRRLASITEMIHVASLLHDDVIDNSDLRRNQPSAPSSFGNKLSILSGDFLLGRASVALARLGSREVVELLATVIANLVEGEVMQLKSTDSPETTPSRKGFEEYMRKTYLKTASLMAKSARAAVILGGCGKGEGEWIKEVAYGYGRNLGIAFQLIDDALDFSPLSTQQLGKPSGGADLRLGLATAPALFAWETEPAMGPLILRKFEAPGDVALAREMVERSQGVERTVELARVFASEAKGLVMRLPESAARDALVELTEKVVDRVK